MAKAHDVLGILGDVTSGAYLLSSLIVAVEIYQGNSTANHSCVPYLTAIMNCACWIFYGVVNPNNKSILIVNGIGLVIQFICLLIFACYCTAHRRRIISVVFIAELLAFVVIMVIVEWAWKPFAGVAATVFNICMFGSPLLVVRQVIRTNDTAPMPLLPCFIGLVNNSIWLAYAFVSSDYYVMASSGFGICFGFLQIIVRAYLAAPFCLGLLQLIEMAYHTPSAPSATPSATS